MDEPSSTPSPKFLPFSRYDFMRQRLRCLSLMKSAKMARFAHYSPPIRRELVRVLYHERVRRNIPMTRLVESILTEALKNTVSWRMMEEPPAYKPSEADK